MTSNSSPLFSIIIATRNRSRALANCLNGILALDYPRERIEVVVVDDGSNPPLEALVAPFGEQIALKYVRQRGQNVAVARNTGAAHSGGQYLVFPDDDCIPFPDWLSKLEARVAANPGKMIGGVTVNLLADNLFSEATQLITDMGQAYYNADPDNARLISGNSMCVPADLFRALNGFDPAFFRSQDREFCDRLVHLGYTIVYAPEVRQYHAHHLTLLAFARQHFRYGQGAYLYHRVRARRGSGSLIAETHYIRSLRNWLLYPLSHVEGRRKHLFVPLLLLWQLANTSGYFWEAFRQLWADARRRLRAGAVRRYEDAG